VTVPQTNKYAAASLSVERGRKEWQLSQRHFQRRTKISLKLKMVLSTKPGGENGSHSVHCFS
jgi:hypothetical protein